MPESASVFGLLKGPILASHDRMVIQTKVVIPSQQAVLAGGCGVTCARRILVVDDDRDTRELYAFCLRLAGVDAVVVGDGHTALREARATPPDAVITDLRLPGIDGIELSERLAREGTHVPIILVTGDSSMTIRDRAKAAGIQEVVLKPCLPDELVARLARLAG